jgi:hypothetical protein
MAIRIPILTSFDPKGLKAANAQLGNLRSSVGSLGRNFAVLGAAVAGAGALIAKNAQALARIETINAQTAQTIKSMGNAAGVSATQVEQLAGRLEALTATEAESIQEGANLLLTFKNISNQAGAGNDIFDQTTAVMVDLARAMGTSASGEAIRLGKALNDPIKGIAALTRVGVSFTQQQQDQIKALANSGDLLGAQKIILAELQTQFGGSGAAFAKTFTGQLELMSHELGTIGEEATLSVMPALQGMVEQLRELIPVIGPQLKAAVESVDFVALGQAVVGFTTFLVQNAQAILNTIAAVFAISTAFKAMQVVVGISNVAIALKTWYLAQLASGMTLTTIATNLFANALKLIPFVAITTAIVTVGIEIANTAQKFGQFKTQIDNANTSLSDFQVASAATGGALLDLDLKGFAPVLKIVQDLIKGILTLTGALNNIPKEINTTINIKENVFRDSRSPGYLGSIGGGSGALPAAIASPTGGGGGGVGAKQPSFAETLKRQVTLSRKTGKLVGAGLSEGLAQAITSSNKPVQTANKILQRIQKNGSKAVNRLQRQFNQTAAGQAELSSIAQAQEAASAAAAQAAEQAAREAQQQAEELQRAQEEQARQEAAILAERERVYNSFLDSVKSTFAGIKNSILGAFDLTQLGGSTNAITRNMEKLLVKVRSFASNVSKLSSMGLDPSLLQQVIAAGPLAGARLAQTLVAGGANALGSINAGFAEIGSLSSMIAQTGTESRFGTQAQQTIYNINVDGGVGSGATIGKSIVDAIKAYERTSGAVWQGA